MEIREQIDRILVGEVPEKSWAGIFFGGKSYRKLLLNEFYNSSLVLVNYALRNYRSIFSNPANIFQGFGEHGVMDQKVGYVNLLGLDRDNCIRHWYSERYLRAELNPLNMDNLEKQARGFAKDIVFNCRKPVVVNSPPRGFKPREFYLYFPGIIPGSFLESKIEVEKIIKNQDSS